MFEIVKKSEHFIICSEKPKNIEEIIIELLNNWQFDSLEEAYENYIDNLYTNYYFEKDK